MGLRRSLASRGQRRNPHPPLPKVFEVRCSEYGKRRGLGTAFRLVGAYGNGSFLAHLPFWGPEMVKFAPNFYYCAVDQEKAVFQWKRAVSGPNALLGARNGQIWPEFLLLCCRPRKQPFFQWKRAVSGPSTLWGPEMVKFAPNFCSCAVNQEKAFFQWKRAVSGPSALLGARNAQICTEFLLLCRRPRKGNFSRNEPFK